jgi:hypothetical protein
MTTTTKRTDPHRPSQLKIDDYEFIGCSPHYEFCGYDRDGDSDWEDTNEYPLTDEQIDYINAHRFHGNCMRGIGCDVCGSKPNAVAYFKHIPTGEVITVGLTCCEKIQSGAWEEGQRQARKILLKRKRDAMKIEGEAFIDNQSGLRSVLESGKHEILNDMLNKAYKYGSLSEKQVAFAFKLFAQCVEREEKEAARLAKLEGSTLDCTQRITVTGTVKTVKWQDSDYGGSMKMLVELDSGFKIWGTIPTSNVEATEYYNNAEISLRRYEGTLTKEQVEKLETTMSDNASQIIEINDKVQFTARFEMSKDDATFAFFKRPTKLTKLDS